MPNRNTRVVVYPGHDDDQDEGADAAGRNRKSDGDLVVHDLAGGRIHPLGFGDTYETRLYLSADGRRLVTVDSGPTVESLTDLKTGKVHDLIYVAGTRKVRHRLYEEFESFSPDGRYALLSTSLDDGTEYDVLDARGREVLRRKVPAKYDSLLAELSGDHRTIALSFTERGRDHVRLYDLRSGRSTTVPGDLPKGVGIDELAWGHDGAILLRTGTDDDDAPVREYRLDPKTGEVRLLRTMRRPAHSAAWVLPDLG